MRGHQKYVFELRVREGVHAADQGVDYQRRVVEAKAPEQGAPSARGKYKSMTFTRLVWDVLMPFIRQNHNNSNVMLRQRRRGPGEQRQHRHF